MDKNQNILWMGRTLVLLISEVAGLMLMTWLLPGLSINSWETALIVVVLVGIINAIFWPILSYYTLPFLVFTFGVGTLLLNGLLIWFISLFVPGITIKDSALFLVPLGIALINTLVSGALTIGDEASYYRSVLRRYAERFSKNNHSDKPGVIFLEIDGLAEAVLQNALDKGYMPTLKGWIEKGSHKILQWETDLSSQTGASQAGILHGNNHDMPAFRWVEKENDNKLRVSTGLFDAPLLERRVSDGKGLLAINGASRSNLFSGDALNAIFTYSKLSDLSKFYTKAWYFFYSNPYNFARTIVLLVWDILLEIASRFRQWRKDVRPRMNRSILYLVVRATANVFLREITTSTIIGDIFTGRADAVYATYVGYDEIAHHSGTKDSDAFYALKQLDKQFLLLDDARKSASRPYHFVILSDHGQSNGATFKQRYGISLEGLVRELIPKDLKIYYEFDTNEDHFSQVITYPIADGKRWISEKRENAIKGSKEFTGNIKQSIERQETKWMKEKRENAVKNGKEFTGNIWQSLDKDDKISERLEKFNEALKIPVKAREKPITHKEADVTVLASGNLGLIYFKKWENRMTFEEINAVFPELIPGLIQHEGIGFIMVRSSKEGPLVIGSKGIYYLKNDRIEGENPLKGFGKNAALHLKRTDSFKYVPDILVNSLYDAQRNEVAAFEELIGSHGGLGGEQSKPFLLYPSSWNLEKEEIIGAEKLHSILKSKLNELWSTTENL
ncbi:phage holin family protein [Methanobacterium sp. MBAC-LM]|uniref:phage holin family protein n=1 Tax=Methanobacterium sp. MBAC-LM TaxID=3412034 RepID=UPI003C739584